MKARISKSITAAALALTLGCAGFPASASDSPRDPHSSDRAADMAADAVLVRPFGVIGTVLGTAIWVVSLPFTIPSGSTGDAAQELIGKPLGYTFSRPLGDFSRCDPRSEAGC